jgi:hypothetical protein
MRELRWLKIAALAGVVLANVGCLPHSRIPRGALYRSVTFDSASSLPVRWRASQAGETWDVLNDVRAIGGEVVGLWSDTLVLRPTYITLDAVRGEGGRATVTLKAPSRRVPELTVVSLVAAGAAAGAYHVPGTPSDMVSSVLQTLGPGAFALAISVFVLGSCK